MNEKNEELLLKQHNKQEWQTSFFDEAEKLGEAKDYYNPSYMGTQEVVDEEFAKRKKQNPDITLSMHKFQKGCLESVKDHAVNEDDWLKAELKLDLISKLDSDDHEEQKKAFDAMVKNYLAIELPENALDENYMPLHGDEIMRIVNLTKSMSLLMDDKDNQWYFEQMPGTEYIKLHSLTDLLNCYEHCIYYTLRSQGLNPILSDIKDENDLDVPATEEQRERARENLLTEKDKLKKQFKSYKKTLKYTDPESLKKNKKADEELKRMDLSKKAKMITGEDREKLRNKKDYTIEKVSKEQSDSKKKKINKKMHINDVENALMQVMGDAYKEMHDMLMDPESQKQKVELVHSVGTQLLEKGHDVLEIDVGGSSFSEFRKEYEGLHGKHKEDDKSLDDRYGQLTDEKDKYIRSKTTDKKVEVGGELKSRNKTRYTMPGPLGLGGKLNTGDYSIEKTRVRIRDYGAKYLTPIFKKWEEDVNNNTTPDFHDIDLMIRGHSRGGVGASQGAMMLKSWIHDNYPHFEMFVQFHMIQYDPVPGGDVTTKSKFKDEAYERFDYEQYQGVHGGDFTIGGEKMRAVGRDSSSTVVYSMVNQDDFIHNTMFKPQEVLHAKRLILTPFNHDVGLDMEHIDETQTGGETKEKAHGMAYYDATSKKVYRNSGIDALGDGVYVMDENQIMVRVDSLAQLKSILALTMPEDFQKERQARILRAAASILGESADMDDYAPINHARTLALSDKIKDGVGFMASKYRKDVVKKMDALKKTLGSGFSADKNGVLDTTQIMGAYDEAIKACAVYVEKRSGDKFTDKGDQRLDEIRTLYTNLIKDREFVKKEAEKRRTDRTAATWDELFDTTSEIDISDANEMTGGMLRKEKSTGVSFIEKQDEKTEKKHGSAKGVAFSSRFAEMYSGVSGLYQGAQYAKLKNGDEESEGLVIEQLPPMSLEKLVKKYPEALIDSEIKEKVDKITAMDLVLGMDSLKKRKELRVTYTLDPKTKEVVIRDVIAPMHVSAFADGGTAVITEGESKLLRRLSSGAKEMIKKMNVDADRIKKWGLIDPEKIDVLVTRIQNLQKLL